MTRLVVGLGNPGPEYRWTRHNIGFHAVDALAEELGLFFRSASKLDGYSGSRRFEWAHAPEHDALLVKPTTFMNRSGEAVAPLLRFARGESTPDAGAEEGEQPPREGAPEVMVVYDDLDLELGRLRIRPHGGHGGQNGMRSIIEHLGTDRFPRLRVGIGRSGTDAARHVLSPFSDQERVEAEISVREAAEALLDWLTTDDLSACMTRFHSRWNP
jgi:PTH1 family peptidyl-tRNA hydrolase